MEPTNLEKIKRSFSIQAKDFEKKDMSFSKQDYLDFTMGAVGAKGTDAVLEVASGTCVCGRALAAHAASVTCIDATGDMLAVGRAEAEKRGLSNMTFLEGYAERLPFADECFDIVLTRLSFHHFTEMEAPFREMNRVLKRGGKLVIIDMEAAPEALREREDALETLRDFSHVKNRSRAEFLALFERYGYSMAAVEATPIPVRLRAWMDLTKLAGEPRAQIVRHMEAELRGDEQTGFFPYINDGELYFNQRWLFLMGVKG